MDQFEELISNLLEAEGYWVKNSVRIDLSTEEKERVGKKTMP